MPDLPLFTVDSFSSKPFAGNPAAVCLDVTEDGLADDIMQKIAAEMNIVETAFIQKLSQDDDFKQSSRFKLRWFTPVTEVPMCGHGTLAAAAALFNGIGNTNPRLVFSTLSGDLSAITRDGLIGLDLPLNPPKQVSAADFEELIKHAVGDKVVKDVMFSPTPIKALVIRLEDSITREAFEEMSPQIEKFMESVVSQPLEGVILTVKGNVDTVDGNGRPYDYLMRFFAPWLGIIEDPVCGAAQTILVPYWMEKLGKKELYAHQCSKRGGDIQLELREDGRLDELGPATIVVKGTFIL